jgi:hypothetical protein
MGAEGEAYPQPIALAGLDGFLQQDGRHHAQIVDDRGPAFAHGLPPGRCVEPIELDQA